jgi:hypothetical protein
VSTTDRGDGPVANFSQSLPDVIGLKHVQSGNATVGTAGAITFFETTCDEKTVGSLENFAYPLFPGYGKFVDTCPYNGKPYTIHIVRLQFRSVITSKMNIQPSFIILYLLLHTTVVNLQDILISTKIIREYPTKFFSSDNRHLHCRFTDSSMEPVLASGQRIALTTPYFFIQLLQSVIAVIATMDESICHRIHLSAVPPRILRAPPMGLLKSLIFEPITRPQT